MKIDVNLTEKQSRCFKHLLDPEKTEVLYGGAAGGGKSYLGCIWILSLCVQYPGVRCLIGRSKLSSLKQSTVKTLFDIFSAAGMKQETHYKYNQHLNTIFLTNGSEIILKDLYQYPGDPNFDSLGSIELSAAFIDEVNQITEKAKNIVMSRIRYKLDEYKLTPTMLMTCNPALGWVYEQFYKKDRDGKLETYKAFVPALVTDNPNISRHYIDNLHKLDEISKKRLLHGQWEYADDLCLINYDRLIGSFNVTDPEKITHLSCDIARLGKDKTVIIKWNGLEIIGIEEMSKVTTDVSSARIKEIARENNVRHANIIIDVDGIGGGVVDQVKDCVSFVNNSRPFNADNYSNLKTQCIYKLAEIINADRLRIYEECPIDMKMRIVQELSIIKADKVGTGTKLSVISKDEIKKQISRSPDYSDAIMMRMYYEFEKEIEGEWIFI